MNTQIENMNQKEYLCIGDYHTQKKLAIHSIEDQDSTILVPLNKITELGEKILAYEVHSLDTIMILPHHSNILYFINRDGEIWKDVDLNPYLEKEGYYELNRSSTPFQFNDSTLIFSLEYSSKNLPLNEREDLNYYYQGKYAAPSLFKIENIFGDTLSCTFGLRELYNNFADNQSVCIEGNLFTFLENKIIFNSAYSDSLYVIDSQTLEIEKKVEIQSKFSGLSIQPISIDDLQSSPEKLNSNFQSNGQIRDIIYDKKQNQYSVIVNHKPDTEEYPWSILTLTDNFQKLNEIKMDDSKYYSKVWSSKKGLIVSNYFETLKDHDHFSKNTFTLFQHE